MVCYGRIITPQVKMSSSPGSRAAGTSGSSDGRVVLITGCSTGIGRALAQAFVERGCRVVATARKLEALADLEGERLRALRLDVTDAASIRDAVLDVLSHERRVDVLVNNAGYGQFGPMAEVTPEALRRQLDTNVVGPLAVARAVLPDMLARRSGLIVNVGSVSGLVTTPFSGAYCASKAALHAVSDALRLELAPFGVRVVTLQPGAVRTAFSDSGQASLAGIDWGTSRYAPFRAAVEARARTAAASGMDAAQFSRETVEAILSDPPPAIDRRGPKAALMAFLQLLPTSLRDRKLTRLFGLDRVKV
jgi:NAD(P)-dependent dehydrogenase (short-subunit alcohol dehydrogenase family)